MNIKVTGNYREVHCNTNKVLGLTLNLKLDLPKRVRIAIMKRRGLCGKEHSQYDNWLCTLHKGHNGFCSCS